MKHNSPGYLRISLIFMNLLDIHECPGYLGPMKHESPGYLGHMKCYSPDIRESPGYSGPMKLESPGYSGPMKHKSPVYLRISGIFRLGPTKHKSLVYTANLLPVQGTCKTCVPVSPCFIHVDETSIACNNLKLFYNSGSIYRMLVVHANACFQNN